VQNGVVYAQHVPAQHHAWREMNWLRLERSYEGAEDGRFTEEFETRFVRCCVTLRHAPCEAGVCPVYATVSLAGRPERAGLQRCVARATLEQLSLQGRYFNWFGYGEPHRAQYAVPGAATGS